MSNTPQPQETVPETSKVEEVPAIDFEFVETHPKYIEAIKEIMDDPLYRQKFWEIHKEIKCPVDPNDRLYATYKFDPYRINYTAIQKADIKDVKQFVDRRIQYDSRNKVTNLTGIIGDISNILNDFNFFIYCKNNEGKDGNKYGTEEVLNKQYKNVAYNLIKMYRITEFLNGKGCTKSELEKNTLKRTSIFNRKPKKTTKKVEESKPKKE